MKDRVSYESQVLYVGPSQTGTAGDFLISGLTPTQLHKIQRLESSLDVGSQNVYQYGNINSLGRVVPDLIDVSLEFEYPLADAQNEKWLGFTLSNLETPAVSGLLSGIFDEQNYYILNKKRGDTYTTGDTQFFLDENSGANNLSVTSFGECVIENYYIEASLTDIPTATVALNANNVTYATGASEIDSPSIKGTGCRATGKVTIPAPKQSDLQVDALRPASITLNFGTHSLEGGGPVLPGNTEADNFSACSLESFLINLNLPRRINQRLGNRYPLSKPIISNQAYVTMECLAKERDVVSGNLIDVFCSGARDIQIDMDNPYNDSGNIKIGIKDAYLQTHASELSLVQNGMVNLEFQAPLVGGDVSSTGFYLSGVANTTQSTTYGLTTTQLLENDRNQR